MGAGCSTGKAVQVEDSVAQKNKLNADQLSQEAQQYLKQLQQAGGDLNSTANAELLKKLAQAGIQLRDEDVSNKDTLKDEVNKLKHLELWEAVELNDSQRIQNYLSKYEEQHGEELKESELYDFNGNTMIHKAASLGNAEALMLLLERTGAKPDLPNAALATPLHLACKNNRIDACKFLIGCGVDANAQDEHGQVPLLICCIHGHYELTKMLLDASELGHLPEPIEVDLKDHRGLSPLNCAAIKGDLEMTKILINQGHSHVDGQSPKGCTPLLYAARGGFAEVVRFLLSKGASPLRQDNAGGTVLHHAIEKGHIEVLQVLQEHGVDIYSAIEIPDNAGRTPIFEAVDNHDTPEILKLLTKSRKQGGFEAKVNIMNYGGQTPLFSASREGNLSMIKCLVEDAGAIVDLNQGELYREEYDDGDYQQYDSLQEKFFMDAYKNAMTPLHISVIFGYEDCMLYLIERGANPNLQTKIKGFTALHLAVLANKPEIIIELLTKTQANPYLPDFSGRTLQEMVEIFIPSYLESFNTLLENLQFVKQNGFSETQESESLAGLAGLAKRDAPDTAAIVAVHYYNPNDDRSLQGVADQERIKTLYQNAEAKDIQDQEISGNADNIGKEKKFSQVDENDIEVESELKLDQIIANFFGTKIARAIIAVDWKFKEAALKIVYKQAERYVAIDQQSTPRDVQAPLHELVKAAIAIVGHTCREKVIKVLSGSLALLNQLVSSQKVEKSPRATEVLKNTIVERNIVLKLLQKSEEGNTRITNKIHECLLDLSFNPQIGEALTSSFILQRIQAHNRASAQKSAQKNYVQQEEDDVEDRQIPEATDQIETENSLGSYKGLLAQLALLYKFINSFGISSRTRGPLSVTDVLKSVLPSVQHPNQDVRTASMKILIDVQKLSGCVTEDELIQIPEKVRNQLLQKIKEVKIEKDLNNGAQRGGANLADKFTLHLGKSGLKEAIEEEAEEGEDTYRAEVQQIITMNSPGNSGTTDPLFIKKHFEELKNIIEEKGSKKDWQERELALKAMYEVFEAKNKKTEFLEEDFLNEDFLQTCLVLLKTCLEENNVAIYIQAIEVAALFFQKSLHTDVVYSSISSLASAIMLKTTDTNTRIRKRSVELINQLWDFKPDKTQRTPQGKKQQAAGTLGLRLQLVRDSMDGTSVNKGLGQGGEGEQRREPMGQLIAAMICEVQHGEKAIIGRLGLFVKRASVIEGHTDLKNKSLQVIIGRTYEQLIEFACQWISHKNTKVRQNALKLIVEVCRINCMDPRGNPFKSRIVSFILGLRPGQRDPLIEKINEVCRKHIVANTSPGRAGSLRPFINAEELDLPVSKNRAASMDHVAARKRLQSANRYGQRNVQADSNKELLPQIGGSGIPSLPSAAPGVSVNQGVIVLPHSEPLNEEQLKNAEHLIELFGQRIITCFLSKTWATRLASIEKVEEQIQNLDPNRRDAMSAEINRANLPIEINFKTFLDFMILGIQDPVLKNYIQILELFQLALPIFFRHISHSIIQSEIKQLIRGVLRKTADMKQKIREASVKFCLYLSHQSPVGPTYMIEQVLHELDYVLNSSSSDNKTSALDHTQLKQKTQQQDQSINQQVATTFGNSHMIVACLGLLSDYQIQSKIISMSNQTQCQDLLNKFMNQINTSLRHSNPQVRKEGERLFKILYQEFGQKLEELLIDQKQSLQQKLIAQAKQEVLAQRPSVIDGLSIRPTSNQVSSQNAPGSPSRRGTQDVNVQVVNGITQAQTAEINKQRAQDQIRDQVFQSQQLKEVLAGAEQHLQALKHPNTKKRQAAILEIKKTISKKIVTQMSQDRARDLFEPLTLLMRQLLQDESSEIFLEALALLKFVIGSLAPYMSSLDLHLMMGSFIGLILQNTTTNSKNQGQPGIMRAQVATDKVIVFFAKHQNIGPFIVGNEIIKNIDRINQQAISMVTKPNGLLNQANFIDEKQQLFLRFYGILQLLLVQFSLVLCYQPDFYIRTLEILADTLNLMNSQQTSQNRGANQGEVGNQYITIKHSCIQIVYNLYTIDYKLLDASVSKLDNIQRKTPLRKTIIEHESSIKQGKGYMDLGTQSGSKTLMTNEQEFRNTQQAISQSSNQTSLFSPGSTVRSAFGASPSLGAFGASQYGDGSIWKAGQPVQGRESRGTNRDNDSTAFGQSFGSSSKLMNRRMMSLQAHEEPSTPTRRLDSYKNNNGQQSLNNPVSNLTQSTWQKSEENFSAKNNLTKTGVLLPKIGPANSLGGASSYQFEPSMRSPNENRKGASEVEFVGQRERGGSEVGSKKLTLKSTGGAGFNSSKQQQEEPNTSCYEPSSASRRTPRRTLGSIINNNTKPPKPQLSMEENNYQKQTGLAPTGNILAARIGLGQMRNIDNSIPQSTTSQTIKPPLYVPTMRAPSDKKIPNQPEYQSKTGFSSLNPTSNTVNSGQNYFNGGSDKAPLRRLNSRTRDVDK